MALALHAPSKYAGMDDASELHPDLDEVEIEALREAVAEADAAAQAGRVVSHNRVRPWLLDLAHGKRTARPKLD